MKPRILMSVWRRQGRTFGPVLRDMYGVEVQYAHAVQRAGAQVFLAPIPAPGTKADEVLRGFDGLVLIGGEDLAAETSSADPLTIGENASAARDSWEQSLLRSAIDQDLSVLALCRGMQILNVAYGGTLMGDIADSSPEHPHVPTDLDQALAYRHAVTLAADSHAARAFGATTVTTNSLHHQALGRVADGIRVTGTTADGIVEAVEAEFARWCVGVQWHPELMPSDERQQSLFASFLQACCGATERAAQTASTR